MPTSSILILLSGGLDSAACISYYLKNQKSIYGTLFVDYGQAAAIYELEAAKKISQYYSIALTKISVSGMGSFN